MEASEILNQLKQGDFSPVYFLSGEEPHPIDQISDFIGEHAIPKEQQGFNRIIRYGKEADLPQVIGSARGYPMMGERQVILIKEAQVMPDWKNEKKRELFEQYIKNPQPSTILVICYRQASLDARTSFAKTVRQYTTFLESKKLREYEVVPWIESRLTDMSYQFTERAVWLLAQNIGNNLERLSNEIEKLAASVDKGELIDEARIARQIGVNREYTVFELQKALATKNLGQALKIASYFAGNPKSNPFLMILAMLTTYFSRMLAYVHANKTGSVASLKLNPMALREYQTVSRNFSSDSLERIIAALHQADLQYKNMIVASIDESQVWKELIMKLSDPQ